MLGYGNDRGSRPVTGPAGSTVFLRQLAGHPDLLEAIPAGATPVHITARERDETHDCLRCGSRATAALVVETTAGLRWLDLCDGCARSVRSGPYSADSTGIIRRLLNRFRGKSIL
jgi:hypothetical protein